MPKRRINIAKASTIQDEKKEDISNDENAVKIENVSDVKIETVVKDENVSNVDEVSQVDGGITNSLNEEIDDCSQSEKSLIEKILRKKLAATYGNAVIQRNDPNSPLYSVKSFEELNLKDELLNGLFKLGMYKPSKIQETVIPILLANPPKNLIAQSQTGTGKTAAFILAMLSRVDASKKYPQVLCLCPTYELAIQIGEVAACMATYCRDIQIKYIVSGERVPKSNIREQIIIGTPGKILDCGIKYKLFDLKKIVVFVLDEGDVMLDTQGHQDQSIRIQRELSPSCQIMLFSATYNEKVMAYAKDVVKEPIIVTLKKEDECLTEIQQLYIYCSKNKKHQVVRDIYGSMGIGQSIIFCRTKGNALHVERQMQHDGHAVVSLISDMHVQERISVLDRFRGGKWRVLITTNVLSRGIDIEQVNLVINYDLPVDQAGNADFENYLHRIGRTGRFGRKGIAINLVESKGALKILNDIAEHYGRDIEELEYDDLDKLETILL